MLKAKDIMTSDVVTIQPSALVSEAIGLMRQKKIHAIVVKSRPPEKAYGIVTEADIAYKVVARDSDPKALTVGDIMTKPCITVNPEMTVENVARLFANNHIHRAPVVKDELLGIISISDILQKGKWWQD
ncbi:MAG: CBS domain-containing protein [Anaerolineae bacterium]|nr:CBS domain-containing protein [Anaerolineae bacterium]